MEEVPICELRMFGVRGIRLWTSIEDIMENCGARDEILKLHEDQPA